MSSARRKSAAVALAVVGVAGLTLASAAQLNVSSASLGAGTSVVASCTDQTIRVGFENAYAASGYATTAVTLSAVPASCAGQAVTVTVANAAGESLGEAAGTAAPGSVSLDLGASVPASSIARVAVVISG